MRLPQQTLPLLNMPKAVALPISSLTLWDTISDLFQLSLRHLACLGIIAALITLNASFAWELGGEAPQFLGGICVCPDGARPDAAIPDGGSVFVFRARLKPFWQALPFRLRYCCLRFPFCLRPRSCRRRFCWEPR